MSLGQPQQPHGGTQLSLELTWTPQQAQHGRISATIVSSNGNRILVGSGLDRLSPFGHQPATHGLSLFLGVSTQKRWITHRRAANLLLQQLSIAQKRHLLSGTPGPRPPTSDRPIFHVSRTRKEPTVVAVLQHQWGFKHTRMLVVGLPAHAAIGIQGHRTGPLPPQPFANRWESSDVIGRDCS